MTEELNNRIDALIRLYDPCCLCGHSCLVSEKNPCCFNTRFKREDPNDIRCLYLGENGCTYPNLECRIWFCDTAIKAMNPECLRGVIEIEAEAKRLGLISPPYIGDHYYGADKELN